MSGNNSFSGLYSRRKALSTLGAGLAVGLAGCSQSSDGESGNESGGHGGSGTEAGELQQQLDTVRSATEQYSDVQAALDDGFDISGPYVPGMGWHLINEDRVGAAAENGFSLDSPQVLSYVEADGELTLAAAEFAGPAEQVADNPDLFADENADATEEWHTHEAATHVFANGDGEQTNPEDIPLEDWTNNDYWSEFQPPDGELEAGDTVSLKWGSAEGKSGSESEREERTADVVSTHPTLNTLHVWVHEDNPDGVFAAMNPNFMPDEGDSHH